MEIPPQKHNTPHAEPHQCAVTLERNKLENVLENLHSVMEKHQLDDRHIVITQTPIGISDVFLKVTFTAQMQGKRSAAMQVYGVLRPHDQHEALPQGF